MFIFSKVEKINIKILRGRHRGSGNVLKARENLSILLGDACFFTHFDNERFSLRRLRAYTSQIVLKYDKNYRRSLPVTKDLY